MIMVQYPFCISLNQDSPNILSETNNAIYSSENAELVVFLHEWKDVHHMAHSLLDDLQMVEAALLKCQLSPKKSDQDLEPYLYWAETNWKACVTGIQTMIEIFNGFKKIKTASVIRKFSANSNNIQKLSIRIGEGDNDIDVFKIQTELVI